MTKHSWLTKRYDSSGTAPVPWVYVTWCQEELPPDSEQAVQDTEFAEAWNRQERTGMCLQCANGMGLPNE